MKWTKAGLLALPAAALMSVGVQAADLGGNCCADLEERVAELEATVARKGNRAMSLTISGHMSEIMLWHDRDDLIKKRVKILENSVSPSRFKFSGEGKVNAEWAAGFVMEFGAGADDGSPNTRQSYVWVRSASLGTFSLGKQSDARDGIIEIDLSRSRNFHLNGSLDPLAAFVDAETGLSFANPLDGTRNQSFKWRSPMLGGILWAEASVTDNQTYAASLRFATEGGGFRVAGGAGYGSTNVNSNIPTTDEHREDYGGSISIKHLGSGLFVNGFYARSDGPQSFAFSTMGLTQTFSLPFELTAYGGKVGIEFPMGTGVQGTLWGGLTRYEVDITQLVPQAPNWEPDEWSGGFNLYLSEAATDLGIVVRYIDAKEPFGMVLEDNDILVVYGGAKVRF